MSLEDSIKRQNKFERCAKCFTLKEMCSTCENNFAIIEGLKAQIAGEQKFADDQYQKGYNEAKQIALGELTTLRTTNERLEREVKLEAALGEKQYQEGKKAGAFVYQERIIKAVRLLKEQRTVAAIAALLEGEK